jgi:hypothetical protein
MSEGMSMYGNQRQGHQGRSSATVGLTRDPLVIRDYDISTTAHDHSHTITLTARYRTSKRHTSCSNKKCSSPSHVIDQDRAVAVREDCQWPSLMCPLPSLLLSFQCRMSKPTIVLKLSSRFILGNLCCFHHDFVSSAQAPPICSM